MRAYDIRLQFPPKPGSEPGEEGPAHILKAVYLPGEDPHFEAIQHVAPDWGTKGFTVHVQPSE